MSIENPGAPAAPAGSPADAGTPATPAAAPDAAAAPSHRDWNAMAQNQRDTLRALGEVAALLKSSAPKPAADPVVRPSTGGDAAELAEMRERLALSEAIDDLGIPMSREHKETVRKLQRVDKPTDVGDWLAKTVDLLGVKRQVAPATAAAPAAVPTPTVAPAVPARPFDPGAPSGAPASGIPLDPLAIPQSVVDAMTPAQALEWYQRYKAQGGAPQHPFHAARQAEKAAGSTAETARQIAVALSNLTNNK